MNNNQYYDKYKRNEESRSFYKSKAWEKVRELALQRDDYLCQDCFDKETITLRGLKIILSSLYNWKNLEVFVMFSITNNILKRERKNKDC